MTVAIECPACHGSGLAGLCLAPLPGGDRCVLRAPCDGPHYGEDDVASDWTPAAPCASCCVCPDCGSALVPFAESSSSACETCGFVGALPGFVLQAEP